MLINRQDAIDALDGTVTVTGRTNAEAVRGYANLVQDRIKRLPSAERKGEWILAEDGWYCSVCELYPQFDCDPEEEVNHEGIKHNRSKLYQYATNIQHERTVSQSYSRDC